MDMDFVRYLITLLKTYYPYFVNYVSLSMYILCVDFGLLKSILSGILPESKNPIIKLIHIMLLLQLMIFEMPWLLNGKTNA